MRDFLTGETYYDDPDRDLTPEPVLLGRWAATEPATKRRIRTTPDSESVQGSLMAWLNEKER